MRTPINLADLYYRLQRISPRLSAAAADSVGSVLRSNSPALLRLSFLPLHPGELIEVHQDSICARAAPLDVGQDQRRDACLWLVFEEASAGEVIQEVAPELCAAGDQKQPRACDLAELLEAFHFFAPLKCMSEIHLLDTDLGQQITAIQQLQAVCGSELHGEQLSLRVPAVIGCSEPDRLRVSALAPLDRPASDHIRYRMAVTQPGFATLVVLGPTEIALEPDPTVRLTRVR